MRESLGRVGAMTLRYWYLLSRSWPRLLDLVYWPALSMITWGLINVYFSDHATILTATAGMLLGAVMLWDVLLRGNLGFTYSFLEEIWSRNIANLMMSPLRPGEFAASLMLISLIRLVLGMAPVTLLAFVLFGFNIYGFGFPLIAFFVNLVIVSWTVGLIVAGMVLRNGQGAESLAWSVSIILVPLSCIYYPVSILPGWLQPLAWSLPTTYVFEGMRAVVLDQVFRVDLMLEGFALNAVYLTLGFAAFMMLVQSARRKGSILAMGE